MSAVVKENWFKFKVMIHSIAKAANLRQAARAALGMPFAARTVLGIMAFPDYLAMQVVRPDYEPNTKVQIESLRSGLFVDVGAQSGFYSVTAATKGNEVIAVEADPQTFSCLVSNLSNFKATCINAAAWNKDENLRFTRKGLHRIQAEGEIKVHADTLGHILKGRVPDLVKIDVEGAEVQVLEGLTVEPLQIIFECQDHKRLEACKNLLPNYEVALLDSGVHNFLAKKKIG